VLIDNIRRDKQLNTAYSLESPVAIVLSQVLFKLDNRQSVYTVMSITNLKHAHKQHSEQLALLLKSINVQTVFSPV